MPNTYTQLLFHVVFSTKNRERTLTDGNRDAVYKYILGNSQQPELSPHHRRETFLDEYRRMLAANGIVFDERYLV